MIFSAYTFLQPYFRLAAEEELLLVRLVFLRETPRHQSAFPGRRRRQYHQPPVKADIPSAGRTVFTTSWIMVIVGSQRGSQQSKAVLILRTALSIAPLKTVRLYARRVVPLGGGSSLN